MTAMCYLSKFYELYIIILPVIVIASVNKRMTSLPIKASPKRYFFIIFVLNHFLKKTTVIY
jgi:hypothetical protein